MTLVAKADFLVLWSGILADQAAGLEIYRTIIQIYSPDSLARQNLVSLVGNLVCLIQDHLGFGSAH